MDTIIVHINLTGVALSKKPQDWGNRGTTNKEAWSFRDFFVSGPFVSPVSGFFVMSYPHQLTCALLSISRHFNRGQIEDICSRHAVSFCLQEVGSPLVCQCFLSNQNAEGSKVLWESRLLGTKN